MLTILVSFINMGDAKKQKKNLNKEFPSLREWYIDNKLSIHFGDDRTKTISFSRKKHPPKPNISFGNYSLKEHTT